MTIHGDLSSFLGVKVKPVLTEVAVQQFAAANKQQTSQLSAKLEERFKEKILIRNAAKDTTCVETAGKKWRGKTHERKLQQRYLAPNYVFDLLNQTHLHQYDSGIRPICHNNCKFNCKAKFRYDSELLQQELNTWWGSDSNNIKRDALLYDDLNGHTCDGWSNKR